MLDVLRASGPLARLLVCNIDTCVSRSCDLVQMATALGNKVGKRRWNDNEEGELKKIRLRWQRKQAHKMLCKVHQKEMRTIKKLILEGNDSSTPVSSKLSLLQIISAVILLLDGEVGLRIDGSAPSTSNILRKGNSSLYHRKFQFLRRLSKHAAE